jgi:Na+/H+ antiporter NhaC
MNFLVSIYNSFLLTTQTMLSVLTDSWNAGIVLQVLAIGGLIALVTKIGGTQAIAEKLAVHAKGPDQRPNRDLAHGTWVFFDDYANSLIVGPIMRPVTDRLKVSRAKLAFIIDATAAPVPGSRSFPPGFGYEIAPSGTGSSRRRKRPSSRVWNPTTCL